MSRSAKTLAQTRVLQRRQFAPYAGQVLKIDRRDDHALLVRGACDHASPRIDDHRVAVIGEAVNVGAKLRRRDHVGLILDRAGAEQGVPMGLAGWEGEAAWNAQYLGSGEGQTTIEFGEAQVIADAEPDCAAWRARRDYFAAGQLDVGFLDRHASG